MLSAWPGADFAILTMIIELANVGVRPKAIKLALPPDEIELDVDGVELVDDVRLFRRNGEDR